MNVSTGKVKSSIDPSFEPTKLFEYWENVQESGKPFNFRVSSTPKVLPVPGTEALSPSNLEVGQSKKCLKQKTSSLLNALWDVLRDILFFVVDVSLEFFDFLRIIVFFLIRRKDPIRATIGFELQLWLLMKRSAFQLLRGYGAFFGEQALHFGVGTFISIAIQKFTFIGRQPQELCVNVPAVLYFNCVLPTDQLPLAGMFVALGVMFAGIATGTTTFGREKVVQWRDTSAGMSTVAYFLGKYIVDFPRFLLAGVMYSAGLALFFPYRQPWIFILIIVEFLYAAAFAMGYFISYVAPTSSVSLAGTGFALLWGLVLSGVIPSLDSVLNPKGSFVNITGLWSISSTRWAIEAFWLKEAANRGFELPSKPSNQYVYGNYGTDIYNMFLIQLGWNVISWLAIKLLYRRKQK